MQDLKASTLKSECPLWVKSRHWRRNKSCPLYSQLRLQKRKFALRHVRFTPESRHWRCKKKCPLWANSGHHHPYSMTSSASSKNESRMDRPSSLAALRLMASLNLIGDCADKSPGAAPLRMRSTYSLDRRTTSPVSGP